jgi:hypothetical protein
VIPSNAIVYVGVGSTGVHFVVRPTERVRNRWVWTEPVVLLRSVTWPDTLRPLPQEGFYLLPDTLEVGGARWLRGSLVQLGFDETGRGLLWIGEDRDDEPRSTLVFGQDGMRIDDMLLERLVWVPVLAAKR